MRILSAEFECSVGLFADAPPGGMPEFALIGRSNVGKSTLLNRLSEKKDLARVSNTPGFTRTLNFFRINRRWRLVDLPGYGYAKRAKEDRGHFARLIEDYVMQRQDLVCMLVLVDGSIPPQGIDLDFVQWIGRADRPFAIVFTKMDKAKGSTGVEHVEAFMRTLSQWFTEAPPMFCVSAQAKQGLTELREWMGGVLEELGAEGKGGRPVSRGTRRSAEGEWGRA
jgi:GTP-binding protein